MPGENLQDWSITAATNSAADSLINWAEGQARASVNNSARSMMAAHAKDRNLKNGSIVTTGTANVQAFLSGLSYTTVPTGLRVMLKIGAGLTNTTTATLNMDSIGAVVIKTQFANALIGGELIAGSYLEFLYDGTNWILLNQASSVSSPNSGRLRWNSASTLSFAPLNGDRIKINGLLYAIPAAGIAGLANTGAFVAGVGGGSLGASAVYLVYAFDNGGTVTGDFRLLASNAHATSTTTGNIGTEILTGNDTRTLLGMIMTDAGGGFVDSATSRLVISWFNRRNLALTGVAYQQATASTTLGDVTAVASRCNFLTWGEDAVAATNFGSGNNNTAGLGVMMSAAVDGAATGGTALFVSPGANQWGGLSTTVNLAPVEGFHYLSGFGSAPNGGTATLSAQVTGTIRG